MEDPEIATVVGLWIFLSLITVKFVTVPVPGCCGESPCVHLCNNKININLLNKYKPATPTTPKGGRRAEQWLAETA